MKKIFLILLFLGLLFSFNLTLAQEESPSEKVEVNFFYSKTCPHCAKENEFLDSLEEKYSEIKINKYILNENVDLAKDFFEKNNISKDKLGIVPVTFVNGDFFLGFDNAKGIGAKIENSIKDKLETSGSTDLTSDNKIEIPLIGKINPKEYSLPLLAIIMGTIDGFNVCSLGALILILGLVLTLKSRTKLILYGGIFLLTTAVVYGFLIFFWYKLFDILSEWISTMRLLIGLLATGGGIYLLKEFIRFKKQGAPTCEISNSGFIGTFSKRVKKTIQEDSTTILKTVGTIFLFSVVITTVEFPCSAAAPLVFTGILSEAKVTGVSYILYIALFVLFYLLDEIFIFSIAVWKMSIWMSSPKFVKWSTLIGAIVMFGVGGYYFLSLI